jgi:hypothetical protein
LIFPMAVLTWALLLGLAVVAGKGRQCLLLVSAMSLWGGVTSSRGPGVILAIQTPGVALAQAPAGIPLAPLALAVVLGVARPETPLCLRATAHTQ